MWYLTSESDQRILYIVPNKEVTIGRSVDTQVCNFAIPDDPSISRRHVTLSVFENNLYLQDLGSRYGTFINESTQSLAGNSKIKLNNNDVIKLGKMSSVWKAHNSNFITCTSTLKGENLQNLKLCLGRLAVVLQNEWDENCTYLTMPAITLTIKVVLALAQGSHIVTTEFWTKCLEAVNNQSRLPDASNFTPQVIESTLNKENVSFLPNEERKILFTGKTVIFFSRRQLEMYKTVLLKCSANPLLLSETKMTKSLLCEQNIIVIQYNITNTTQETQAQRNQINDIVNYLKSKDKRVVADAEIGLAILYCSLDKYCNPAFNFSSEVIKQQKPDQTTKSAKILAQESQEPTIKQHKSEHVVINESLTSLTDNDKASSVKRKLSDDDIEINANKKVATGSVGKVTSDNGSVKRKFIDDTNGTSNPSKKMTIDNEDDDIFNFMDNPVKNSTESTAEKKLNFSKPLKRKADNVANDEDGLFNFVQDKKRMSAEGTPSNSIFDTNKVKEEFDKETSKPQKNIYDNETIDISAMRGAKLKELMESNLNWHCDGNIKTVKKEEPDEDLDEKMHNLDLGTTVVTLRTDLIKREPIQILESNEEQGGMMKNFKKFKKVWPVKMQLTVSGKSSTNIILDSTATEMSSLSY